MQIDLHQKEVKRLRISGDNGWTKSLIIVFSRLFFLEEGLGDGQLCVFFRSSHFYTMMNVSNFFLFISNFFLSPVFKMISISRSIHNRQKGNLILSSFLYSSFYSMTMQFMIWLLINAI